MSELLNWVFIISYFSVFFLGLFACFYLAKRYWIARTILGTTIFTKRALTLKAFSTALVGICAIGGLLQAIAGV